MPTVISRMRRLRTLLDVRLGPGAAVISPDVQRLHMKFAIKINDGHRGPRKFWRQYLPRLKYHNPAIPMSVERTTDQEGPASLIIEFARKQRDTSSEDANTTQTINMKNRLEDEILADLLAATNGVQVEPTEEEQQELARLEEERVKSEAARAQSLKKTREAARQAEMLQRARQIGT